MSSSNNHPPDNPRPPNVQIIHATSRHGPRRYQLTTASPRPPPDLRTLVSSPTSPTSDSPESSETKARVRAKAQEATREQEEYRRREISGDGRGRGGGDVQVRVSSGGGGHVEGTSERHQEMSVPSGQDGRTLHDDGRPQHAQSSSISQNHTTSLSTINTYTLYIPSPSPPRNYGTTSPTYSHYPVPNVYPPHLYPNSTSASTPIPMYPPFDDMPPPQYSPHAAQSPDLPSPLMTTETTTLLQSPVDIIPPRHDAEQQRMQRRVRAKTSWCRACFRWLMGATLVVILVIWSIVYLIQGFSKIGDIISDGSSLFGRRYDTLPNGHVAWAPSPLCKPTPHRYPVHSFPLSATPFTNLTIVQTLDHSRDDQQLNRPIRRPFVFGDIQLVPVAVTSGKKSPPPSVSVEVLSNDKRLGTRVTWDDTVQALMVVAPAALERWDDDKAPCVQLRITVAVSPSMQMDRVEISATSLEMVVDPKVFVRAQYASFSSVSGSFTAPGPLTSNFNTTIEAVVLGVSTVSGKIDAVLPRTDRLTVTSASGNVNVNLIPASPQTSSALQPSIIKVKTLSGHLTVRDNLTAFPLRDYLSSVATTSGFLRAELLAGSTTFLNTISGHLEGVLQPVLNPGSVGCGTQVKSSTVSGRHGLVVREPVVGGFPRGDSVGFAIFEEGGFDEGGREAREVFSWLATHNVEGRYSEGEILGRAGFGLDGQESERDGLTCLKSMHSTVSGNLDLAMPPSWQGRFAIKTMSGTINVKGADSGIDEQYVAPRTVMGYKGKGLSSCLINTVSGKIHVDLGG